MPLTSEDLAGLGISADLAVHYVRAGWLTRLTRGVFCRPNDTLALYPSLVLLQRRFEGLHVGGKSALDWYGVRQYVPQQPLLQLYGWAAGRLPEWFTERFAAEYHRKRLFDEQPGALLHVGPFEKRGGAPPVAAWASWAWPSRRSAPWVTTRSPSVRPASTSAVVSPMRPSWMSRAA